MPSRLNDRLVKFIAAASFLIVSAVLTSAHPLGNFSINKFTRIGIEKGQVRLHCVLDMAEIPTFQESQKIDVDKNGTLDQSELTRYLEDITAEFISRLALRLDDRPVLLQADSKNITVPLGSANLPTIRIEWDLKADISSIDPAVPHHVKFENNNFKERVGWNEIVVNRTAGFSVFESSAFGSGLTNELKAYPENMLTTPLAENTAEFSFTPGPVPQNTRLLQDRNGGVSPAVEKDKFTELISVPEITPTIALLGMLLAFAFGAMHAMSPGHGKTIVGAYLVGSRGTVKHALFLGLTVTITHTLGVFALGFLTLFASNYILPEKLMPILSFISGLLVFIIGFFLFKNRLLDAFKFRGHYDDNHHTDHEHQDHVHNEDEDHLGHTHSHGGSFHTHLPPKQVSWRSLLALGISGGLLPCPSALVLMLSAISLGRVGYGLLLTVIFSFGLAATLTIVGLAFLYVGKFFSGKRLSRSRIVQVLPVFSAFVITCVGAVICYNALA